MPVKHQCREDEVPSGLDLGKVKYGGPFTTKQVEDVEAFCKNTETTVSIGPVFFLNIATRLLFSLYWGHLSLSCNENGVNTSVKSIMLYFGSTSPLLTVVSISLYTCPVCRTGYCSFGGTTSVLCHEHYSIC